MEKTSVPGIFKRGGRYVVTFRDANGKPRKRSAGTLAEARRVKAAVTTDLARGEFREQSSITFEQYARIWARTYTGRTVRGIRPETLADYLREFELRALPRFGSRRLGEIEPRDIKLYAADLEASGLRPATIRQAIAPVRAMLATALEEGVIRSNPASGVRIAVPRTTPDRLDDDDDRAKALTEVELHRLLASVPGPYRDFVSFVAQTGMRISEAIAIRWSDVDLDRGRVQVRRRWYRGAYAPPKSFYGRRSIPLSPGMLVALEGLRSLATSERDLVWRNRSGGPLDPSNLATRMLKPAAAAAGVPWASWHTLRHTCGSLLFRHGANAKQVQAWLGHHSPAFTLAVYVHLLDDDAPDASFFDAITSPSEGTLVATSVATQPDRASTPSPMAMRKSDLAGVL